jgi:hypothetical protein
LQCGSDIKIDVEAARAASSCSCSTLSKLHN